MIRDTLANHTDKNLPLMQRRRVAMKPEKVWIAGLSPDSRAGRMTEPANPTVFGVVKDLGVGLLPLDDVSRVHVASYSDGEAIGFTDDHFVLPPHRVQHRGS